MAGKFKKFARRFITQCNSILFTALLLFYLFIFFFFVLFLFQWSTALEHKRGRADILPKETPIAQHFCLHIRIEFAFSAFALIQVYLYICSIFFSICRRPFFLCVATLLKWMRIVEMVWNNLTCLCSCFQKIVDEINGFCFAMRFINVYYFQLNFFLFIIKRNAHKQTHFGLWYYAN